MVVTLWVLYFIGSRGRTDLAPRLHNYKLPSIYNLVLESDLVAVPYVTN